MSTSYQSRVLHGNGTAIRWFLLPEESIPSDAVLVTEKQEYGQDSRCAECAGSCSEMIIRLSASYDMYLMTGGSTSAQPARARWRLACQYRQNMKMQQ